MSDALPAFTYDPADLPGLRRRLAELPEADTFPDFALTRVEVGPEAIRTLPAVLDALAPETRETVLVMDQTPMRRAGEDLKAFVERLLADAGRRVETVVLEPHGDGQAHADEAEVERLKARLRPGVPVASLGSGTVTDVAKHAAFRWGEEQGTPLPLVTCATANSMVAYTANVAVISRDGVKRTWPSRLCDTLIQDTTVLRDAPAHTGLAGIGDLMPMYVSFGDWYLGYRFGLGTFRQASVDFVEDVRALLPRYAREMGEGTPVGVEVLTRLVTLCGLTATIANESAPLSGYEHVIGHMLDMSAAHFERPVGSHGSQVGMAVLPCTVSFNALLDELDPADVDVDRCYPSPATMRAHVRETFAPIDPSGAMAAECWRDYEVKLAGWTAARPRFEAFLAGWEDERARLRELVAPVDTCTAAIAEAALPLRWEDLPVPIPEEQARWAFANAHLMRRRFSHMDLLHFLGRLDDAFTDRVFARVDAVSHAAR